MTETIKLDPAAVSLNRTEVDITGLVKYEGIDWGDEDVEASMADLAIGSSPVSIRWPNRVITIPLVLRDIPGYTTYASAVTALQQKVSLFQSEGGWLLRQVGATPHYADIEKAKLHLGGSTLAAFNSVDVDAVLTLETVPDFYGNEITLDLAIVTGDLDQVLQLSSASAIIQGTYSGRCRILVTDNSGQSQHGIFWAFRSRYYSASTSAALRYEAEALKAIAPAASGALTGASGSNAVTYASLPAAYTDVLGLQMADNTYLTHVGAYRLWARVYATTATSVQWQWTNGTTQPYVTNDPVSVPSLSAFHIVDLGVAQIDRMPFATNLWYGKIQAKGTDSGNFSVDKIWLQPLSEQNGKMIVPYASGWPDAIVVGNNTTEIRWDGCYRQSGTAWGPIQYVTGRLPRIPASGAESRVVELLLKSTRGDLTTQPDSAMDSMTVQVKYRPSYPYRI